MIAKLAPDLDVSNEAFGFMTFRETVLASGIPARVCRISFSGELAFEVNVSGWFGQRVWEDIHAAGEEFGITPYGTETMHVLRAEKGYPIIGQETDGSVTLVGAPAGFGGNYSLPTPDHLLIDYYDTDGPAGSLDAWGTSADCWEGIMTFPGSSPYVAPYEVCLQ